MPPLPVSVIRVGLVPVTLFREYPAQTEAVEPVEIRARVGGILQRQAFSDGARVNKGDLLFILDQQPFIAALAQARAALAQAEAAWANSKQNLARLRPLVADQAISQQDLDAAVARERADAASVEAGKAQVKQAQLNLDYTTIRAPREGNISKALIKSGGLVNASTTLLTTLYSVDPMYVSFTISESDLITLKSQIGARAANDSRPSARIRLIDGSDYKYPGKLSFVDAAVDPRNGTLQVRLTVPNPESALRPGQFTRVVVPVRQIPDAIVVPQKAVQELQGKHSVFVVGPDDKVQYRDIRAASRVGNNWLVEAGLKPGELVVIDGLTKLKPGSPVKPELVPHA
jgi:membrane fusion protein (multidrug efflux system)